MAKLKGPSAPLLKRKTDFIEPKVEIIIACEGKNTEPKYFEDCVAGYGAGLVTLKILPVTGVPMTLVNAAIQERESLLRKYRRSSNSFDKPFRVWAVFDRDEHPRVEDALALAKANKIDVAFSDPCFEIWPLLHIENYGAQDERHVLQGRLSQLMPSYDHQHAAIIDFDMIKNEFNTAYFRAKRQLLDREQEGRPFSRPSTTVGELVKKIIENGKIGIRRKLI